MTRIRITFLILRQVIKILSAPMRTRRNKNNTFLMLYPRFQGFLPTICIVSTLSFFYSNVSSIQTTKFYSFKVLFCLIL